MQPKSTGKVGNQAVGTRLAAAIWKWQNSSLLSSQPAYQVALPCAP